MSLYGIRTRSGNRLLSVIGATVSSDDEGDRHALERTITVRASTLVGDFGRGTLFCTRDVALAELLLETGRGRQVGDDLTLRLPFGMEAGDLEVCDLVTGHAARSHASSPAAQNLPEGVVPLHPPILAAA